MEWEVKESTQENFLALAIAIFKTVTPEQALNLIYGDENMVTNDIADYLDYYYKKGLSMKEIEKSTSLKRYHVRKAIKETHGKWQPSKKGQKRF